MIDKTNVIPFNKIFPQVKTIKVNTKEEIIDLAQKVSKALRKERDRLAIEQHENHPPSGFFSTSS